MKNFDRLAEDLTFGTRLLFSELGDPWGHVAVRLPEDADRGGAGFLLKHVRAALTSDDPESMMVFDYDGNLIEGKRRIPWETPLYVAIELGDRVLVYSSDFPHFTQTSALSEGFEVFGKRPDLSEETKNRILGENARNLYRLD
jgi:hypothetical protein